LFIHPIPIEHSQRYAPNGAGFRQRRPYGTAALSYNRRDRPYLILINYAGL
jgi:hypothetical protein